jgi:hypothetical protein
MELFWGERSNLRHQDLLGGVLEQESLEPRRNACTRELSSADHVGEVDEL